MRRGLVLGKFMPPHRGHQHLIDFARSYAEQVTVLVCSLADDTIPGSLRHHWVRRLHPDCRVVHVTEAVPQAPEEDPNFWPIWRDLIHRHEPRGIDLVFTSEAYGWRLADELAFLVDGQVVLRQPVDDLVENWRSITFRLSGEQPELTGAVYCERSGDDGRTISCDGDLTAAHLGELGAEHIRPTPMGIDEIAVHIMKGGYHVAADQG